MKYWKVEARCGHIKKNKYIVKTFYVQAENGEEAAGIVRWKPRVKHHHKKAIISTKEIDRETYLAGIKSNQKDPYFQATSKQEQKATCLGIDYETYYEEKEIEYRKKPRIRQYLMKCQLDKEWKKERNTCTYE